MASSDRDSSLSPNPKRAPPSLSRSISPTRDGLKRPRSPTPDGVKRARSRSPSFDGVKRARSRSPSFDGVKRALSRSPSFDGVKRQRRQSLTVDVCRDFLRGACSRVGGNCKFAHPPSSVTVEQDKVIVCGDSRRNKCFRGDSCRYFHPPPHILESLSKETGLEWEREKPNTSSARVCQDFIRGRCERKSCRYIHASTRDKPFGHHHPYEHPILRPPSQSHYSYNEETVQVCKNFLNGVCNRGSCKYFHPNLQPMPSEPTRYERLERHIYSPPQDEKVQVCNDFLKGICRRDSCRFLHPRLEPTGLAKTVYGTVYNNAVLNKLPSPPRTTRTDYGEEKALICRDFMKGLCNRNICKFSHHNIEHTIVDYGSILDISRSPPRLSYERESKSVCRDFMKGLCNRSSCKFVHSFPQRNHHEQPYREAPILPRSPPRSTLGEGVCRDFMKGICDRASCKFVHSISQPNVFGRLNNLAPDRPISPPPSRISHDDEELMVCKDFLKNMCNRNTCKFAHPNPDAKVVDGKVEICRDFLRGSCGRLVCHFYHNKTKN